MSHPAEMSDPTARVFFERLHASEDPWNFGSDAYELGRYESILRFVPPGRFGHVLEPGCSVGVLTDRLADRCGRITAVDISANALVSARRRCARHSNVRFVRSSITDARLDFADHGRSFDLIVLSEVGYYFAETELTSLVRRLIGLADTACSINGTRLIAGHWLGHSVDHVLHGSQVHRVLEGILGPPTHSETKGAESNGFVLDVWDMLPAEASAAHAQESTP